MKVPYLPALTPAFGFCAIFVALITLSPPTRSLAQSGDGGAQESGKETPKPTEDGKENANEKKAVDDVPARNVDLKTEYVLPTTSEEDDKALDSFHHSLANAFEALKTKVKPKKTFRAPYFVWEDCLLQLDTINGTRIVFRNLSRDDGPGNYLWDDLPAGLCNRLRVQLDANDKLHLLGMAIRAARSDGKALCGMLLYQLSRKDASSKKKIKELFQRLTGTTEDPEVVCECFTGKDGPAEEKSTKDLYKTFETGFGQPNETGNKAREALKQVIDRPLGAQLPFIRFLQNHIDKNMKEARKGASKISQKSANPDLYKRLEAARKRALSLIFDSTYWPYPYPPNHAEIQDKLRGLLRSVQNIWFEPDLECLEADAKIGQSVRVVRWALADLKLLDPHEHYTPYHFEEVLRRLAPDHITVEDFHAFVQEKDKHGKTSEEFRQWNRDTRAAWKDKDGAPPDESWDQVAITNDYRVMLGLHAVKLNFKLYWAARHHSTWCMDKLGGEIEHDSPGGPRGNDPQERANFEGFTHGVSENLSSGSRLPFDTHRGWVLSSGHSRNLAHPNHRVVGVARDRDVWTQVFSSHDEGDKNTESKGGK